MTTKNNGWARPVGANRFHYFRGSRSLCGKWLYSGVLDEEDVFDSPENCKACERKRRKEVADAARNAPAAADTEANHD